MIDCSRGPWPLGRRRRQGCATAARGHHRRKPSPVPRGRRGPVPGRRQATGEPARWRRHGGGPARQRRYRPARVGIAGGQLAAQDHARAAFHHVKQRADRWGQVIDPGGEPSRMPPGSAQVRGLVTPTASTSVSGCCGPSPIGLPCSGRTHDPLPGAPAERSPRSPQRRRPRPSRVVRLCRSTGVEKA